jgi:hypothetical protein
MHNMALLAFADTAYGAIWRQKRPRGSAAGHPFDAKAFEAYRAADKQPVAQENSSKIQSSVRVERGRLISRDTPAHISPTADFGH